MTLHAREPKARLGVYGATGHAGRRVARELLRRGHPLALSGRSHAQLHELASDLGGEIDLHPAALDDRESLRGFASSCEVVINCAGPFADTGRPLLESSLASRCHYLDVSAEPAHTQQVFGKYSRLAAMKGVVVVPSMSFYFALGDMLSQAVAGNGPVDEITIAYAIENWLLTRGSKAAASHVASSERPRYCDDELSFVSGELQTQAFEFPSPLGRKAVMEYPAAEPLTVPRHTATRAVRVLMTTETFSPRAFDAEGASAEQRATSTFMIVVRARSGAEARSAVIGGRDIYGLGALIIAEGAVRLVTTDEERPAGVLSPAEAFGPKDFLATVRRFDLVSSLKLSD